MEYRMNLGAWNSVFAVPCEVVDRHLKLAGALQLKVLLWALRHSGEAFTTAALAEATGASEADVRDAMLYWTENGLFRHRLHPRRKKHLRVFGIPGRTRFILPRE